MAELKYKKYIVDNYAQTEAQDRQGRPAGAPPSDARRVINYLNSNIVKGALFAGFVWYLKPFTGGGPNANAAHTHDFDEVLGFIGSDWENPRDLNAEVEFWMEDEKYILTKSCIIFVPKGLKHCPLKLLTCDRPIFHFGMVNDDKVTTLTRQ